MYCIYIYVGFLPFMPNLERRPYLLMSTKRTISITQANPARPTAMETWVPGDRVEREGEERENRCEDGGETVLEEVWKKKKGTTRAKGYEKMKEGGGGGVESGGDGG